MTLSFHYYQVHLQHENVWAFVGNKEKIGVLWSFSHRLNSCGSLNVYVPFPKAQFEMNVMWRALLSATFLCC